MLVTLKGLRICIIETVKNLFKITSLTNWPFLYGKIINTGQFKYNIAISCYVSIT